MTMQADLSRMSTRWPSFLLRNRLLIAVNMLPLALAFYVSQVIGVPLELHTFSALMKLFTAMMPLLLVILMLGRFFHLAAFLRPDRPIQHMLNDARGIFLDLDRMTTGFVALATFMVFMGTFSYLKFAIPHINPFSWDVTFAEWDRMLHFGVDPYRLLMGTIGTPTITMLVNAGYHGWLFLIYFSVIIACYSKADRRAGYTYLIAFTLVWFVGGNLIATMLSSAGPVYYERLGYGDTFVPLTNTLNDYNQITRIWALDVHEMLWQGYVAEGRARGISAMPSMHVASSFLMALYGYSFSRWAGHLMSAFCAVIMIGSVMLAWHYAIDGYLGMLIAYVFWKLSRWMVMRDGTHA